MAESDEFDEFEKMHRELTSAEREQFEASFKSFKEGPHNRSSHSSFDDTPSAATRASTPFVPTIIDYYNWVLYTSDFIKFAMNQMKTQDGLFALYNKIQEHYDKIPNQAKIPKPPDEKTTDFPMTDILSDTNYKLISHETELVSRLSYCLSSLDLMCGILYSYNNGIYIDYSLKMKEWLRMILVVIQTPQPSSKQQRYTGKKQQPPSKKQQPLSKKQQPSSKTGGKSRRRHRKTKRKPYSRRR